MNLTQYVDDLRRELVVAAETGGEEARALAERLTAPLESAARLVLLEALAAAANEITRDLAPGSVDVRLRGRDPEFVVTSPPANQAFEDVDRGVATPTRASAAQPADGEDGSTTRTTLRLPDQLKLKVEDAAGREGLSVNTWLVRAVAAAVEPGRRSGRDHSGGQRFTGWVS
ncbi:MAG: hypothetical protein M3Q98_04790 [Actinomycetota bacterium]|nr:hypothetical protein [Actinomycetota bacterium]